ncbi:hypothetical protein GL267_007275 [Acidithiobacillus ferrianus]|uniref:Outer membrane protein beta-barrel domain-containing protein n=2 Tax=Acidithiobacillus ferrianus TaxID=2678518 RepID=A0A845UDW8_9PROT|nr:hypothetical protein [Acidithiobacillus ferrianus]NDU42074.1 hypothetical protein [Acidithiobacillus ferrianus]
MKKQIIAVAVIASFIPAVAFAGPSIGIGYTNIGLSGHPGRPGVTLTAGNLYSNNLVASGSATLANGFYSMNASLGKLIPAGGVSFEPYVGMGFLNLNYNQQETGYTTSQVNAGYGYFYTQTTPYSYTQGATIQDFFALAGADMNVPIGSRVMLEFGGGYGHTISTFGGNGGSVYQGKAEVGFQIAPHVTASINVRYLHVPGQSVTTEGAGLAYQF